MARGSGVGAGRKGLPIYANLCQRKSEDHNPSNGTVTRGRAVLAPQSLFRAAGAAKPLARHFFGLVMRRFQGIEGVTLIDAEDEFVVWTRPVPVIRASSDRQI